jgi:hypothetical protein
VTQTEVALFLHGATAMGFLALSLCFIRFYRRSADRLFLWFAVAFLVLCVNRIAMVALASRDETEVAIFAVRALAFAIILAAIVDKNRRG